MSLANRIDVGDQPEHRTSKSETANNIGVRRDYEDFEQSFSELFASASQRIKLNDIDAESDFYGSVRESLGRLRDQFEFAYGDSAARSEL